MFVRYNYYNFQPNRYKWK